MRLTGTNDLRNHLELRPNRLRYVAMTAADAGDYVKAKAYATEVLGLASKGGQYEAQNLYYGNYVLGLVALHQGDIASAKYYLLASANTQGWPSLAEYGPYVPLAKALVERGERDVVVDFLERCKRLWPNGVKTLVQWQAIIRAGATPDFGNNLGMIP